MEFDVLSFWKSKVSLVCHPSHLSPWKGYPENLETIWLRNLSPCERTILLFGSGSPGSARLHSSFSRPLGTEWPGWSPLKVDLTEGTSLLRLLEIGWEVCAQVNVWDLSTKWKERSPLPPVSCAGKVGLFLSEGFFITSVLRWVSLWEKKIISQEWFSWENQLSAFGSCNGFKWMYDWTFSCPSEFPLMLNLLMFFVFSLPC